MEMKGMMGGFYRISEWIMRLSVTNLLWIICSIPFIFLFVVVFISGFSGLNTETSTSSLQALLQLLSVFFPALIIAPFTLFPATAAMFTVTRKWVIGEEDVPLLKTFFQGYKSNYKQSMFGGLFFVVTVILIIVNFGFYTNMTNLFQLISYLFIALLFVVIIACINFFSVLVHFHMTFWQIIKNSFLITIGRPFSSMLILISNFAIVYISVTKFNLFLVPFFMGSVAAYMTFFQFNHVFKKIQAKQEKLAEADEKNKLTTE